MLAHSSVHVSVCIRWPWGRDMIQMAAENVPDSWMERRISSAFQPEFSCTHQWASDGNKSGDYSVLYHVQGWVIHLHPLLGQLSLLLLQLQKMLLTLLHTLHCGHHLVLSLKQLLLLCGGHSLKCWILLENHGLYIYICSSVHPYSGNNCFVLHTRV